MLRSPVTLIPGDRTMPRLKLDLDDLVLDTFEADDRTLVAARAEAMMDTHQFRCTYFCTYSACTGLPC
jgi:hypothetical protein